MCLLNLCGSTCVRLSTRLVEYKISWIRKPRCVSVLMMWFYYVLSVGVLTINIIPSKNKVNIKWQSFHGNSLTIVKTVCTVISSMFVNIHICSQYHVPSFVLVLASIGRCLTSVDRTCRHNCWALSNSMASLSMSIVIGKEPNVIKYKVLLGL